MIAGPSGDPPPVAHAYHLYDGSGSDLGRIEHPATVHTGDTIALADGRAAIVVARIEACSSSAVAALLEVMVFPAAREGHPRRAGAPGPTEGEADESPEPGERAQESVAPASA